jgi:hypothetical protein
MALCSKTFRVVYPYRETAAQCTAVQARYCGDAAVTRW